MKVEAFIHHSKVTTALQDLKKFVTDYPVSDIIDDDGHQYVDLVMEGGGVLGIALVGFTYVLEEVGIRFHGIAGASAGSINALLIASHGRRDEAKSSKIVTLLAEKNLYDFVDGDSDARDFINAIVDDAGTVRLGLKFVQVIDNFQEDLGLCPGDAFTTWLSTVLAEQKVTTTQDLLNLMDEVPAGFGHRDGRELSPEQLEAPLALITAEVSTETKVEFPKMAKLFWDDPGTIPPALYARASMSIPFFFQPFIVRNIPQGDAARANWKDPQLAAYDGDMPRRAVFIDGGIMSNFPIDVFHTPYTVPAAPTFGVKLGYDRNKAIKVNSPIQLASAIFNSSRHCLDYDFIKRNPDYKFLVSSIDTKDHNWLDFNLKPEAKIDLFVNGAECAAKFLREFDWQKYKAIRSELAKAYQAAALAPTRLNPPDQ